MGFLLLSGCSSIWTEKTPSRPNPYLNRSARSVQQPKSRSWLGSLFNKEPERAKTVTEFVGKPRPGEDSKK